MRFLLLALATLMTMSFTALAEENSIDKVVERVMSEHQTVEGAGIALAVVNRDSVVYTKTFGYRDQTEKLPVTPTTLFAVGSTTKAFTGLAVSMEFERNALELDMLVTEILPEFLLIDQDITNKL